MMIVYSTTSSNDLLVLGTLPVFLLSVRLYASHRPSPLVFTYSLSPLGSDVNQLI